MATITGTTINSGIVLGTVAGTGTYTSPLTITSTGAVITSSDTAIYGNNSAAWTVLNDGTVAATGTAGSGIALQAGGNTDNTDTGLIQGASGVFIAGAAGTLTNSGTIVGTLSYYGKGVYLAAGGSVVNTGTGLIQGEGYGVFIGGTAGTVTNFGTIHGSFFAAARLSSGGSVDNTGLIQGGDSGVSIAGTAGSVTNSGTISGTFVGVGVAAGSVYNNGLIDGGVSIGVGTVTNLGTIRSAANPQFSDTGVVLNDTDSTLTNAGTITGSSVGVLLWVGGSVDNKGLIEGGSRGVYGSGYYHLPGPGTVTNSGTIRSAYSRGVELSGGGSVDNAGLIQGEAYGILMGFSGTVINSGTIRGGIFGTGVDLFTGGSVDNTGLIEGGNGGIRVANFSGSAGTVTNSGTILSPGTFGVGIVFGAGGTVINTGTISGAGGTAVSFGGSGANLLALGAGYQFAGVVQGSTTGTDTLELLETPGTALTVNYNALGLTSFENVLFGSGGSATLLVSNTSGTLGVTISGFDATSESIDLTGIGADGAITNSDTATDRITVTGSLGSVTLQFDEIDSLVFATAGDGSTGTDLSIACFCGGTLILTDHGEVAIEELAIGDMVMTLSGAARPIKWIGHRAYDGRFIRNNRQVLPIRIAAGALADGVPARDLFVSPEHSLYVAGVLVQAMHLLNGATITQPATADGVAYFHLELDDHDVIFADGAPAETFVDCDNRLMFQNGAEFAALYPQDHRPRWQFCLKRLEWAAVELTAIRAALLDRALVLGHTLDTDPDLHLIVDGAVVRPEAVDGLGYCFQVPAASKAVWLASRSTVPAEIVADARDGRRLGVALAGLVLRDADLRIEVTPGHAALCNGFHPDEGTHRWTDGLGRLPAAWLRCFAGGFALELQLAAADLPYRASAGCSSAADSLRMALHTPFR